MTASIGNLPDISVPSQEGFQVPVDGTGSNSPSQTYRVISDNPDIKVSAAQGPFLTFTISHTAAPGVPNDVTFSNQKITFQLFQDLTPKTTALWVSFVNSGYFTGKFITRINTNFNTSGASPTNILIQGGAPNQNGTGSSGLPGTPYGLELNQQLAFNGPGNLGVAHSSAPNSNDTQFFFTTGPQPSALNYLYTMFGQQVSGAPTVNLLSQVATTTNTALNEQSQPISPVIINSATLSNTNPNGVIHVDATGASPGEVANVTVMAIDPTTNTSTMKTFKVTITALTTPPPASFTFTPLASPVTQTISGNTPQPTPIQLKVTNNNTNASPALTTTYALVNQPLHGTLSNFNASTGTVTYTPNPGFFGTDVFTYQGVLNGTGVSNKTGNVAPVVINVTPQPAVNTGAVRVIGTVLVVTPTPTPVHGPLNQIVVAETSNPQSPANQRLTVTINGNVDTTQPLASSITRIVVYGAKAGDHTTIDPSVDPTIAVTLDGGQGGQNVLQAGAGPTREHGWFGQNTLVGGTGPNQLVGRAGKVKFQPTATTNEIFAGNPHPGYSHFHHYKLRSRVTLTPPGGTFYKFVNNKLVPVPTPPAVKGRLLQQSPSAPGSRAGAAVGPNGAAAATAPKPTPPTLG
jgi:cyclophilin family peptidyl-prolyl cis-trans isomerase